MVSLSRKKIQLKNFYWVRCPKILILLIVLWPFHILFIALADGGMSVFPTAMSIMVSFISAITLLGTPTEIYMTGTMFAYSGKQLESNNY